VSRNRLAALCRAAALVALLLAVLAGYAERTLFSPDQFADRAAAALQDERVHDRVAAELTDQVLRVHPDLLAARPLIEEAASSVVGGAAFRRLFRAAVRDVHAATFRRDLDTVTLTIADAGTVLAAAVEVLQPVVADEIREDSRITLLREGIDERAAGAARLADKIEVLAPLLALLAAALAVAGIWLAADRRRAVGRLGTGTAVVGIVIVLGCALGRSLVLHALAEHDDRDAAAAIWDVYAGDLRTAGWVLAAVGAVVAAAAASLLPPVGLEPALRRAAGWATTEPGRPVLRALRGIALIAAGVFVVTRPAAIVTLLATIGGVVLIYVGVAALLRLVYRPQDRERERGASRRGLVVGALATVLVVGTVALFFAGGGASVAAPAPPGCNGHDELCDRPLDEVVLPATHNAMSAGPDWFASQQDAPIAAQLADGVRGLLIDTHYADRLPNGRVRTDFSGNLIPKAEQDGVSEEAVAAALRLRERLGFRGEGVRGMYLCHTVCELGATPLSDALDDLAAFLVTHPGEVVVVINQDYVTPRDFVEAVTDAGLADHVYTPPASGAWATLGELVEADERLVILAENEAGAAPWYQLAYERLTQETPFSFSRVAQLTDPDLLEASCAPNRGPDGAPLFLINHWITTDPRPLPSNAARVNAYDALLRRARDCEQLRGKLPNLLAVDFYRQGDLFAVADELNGLR
jgi:uncharacterized membrane protein HdeD (DUF308 family)